MRNPSPKFAERRLTGRQPTFHIEKRSVSFYLVLFTLSVAVAGAWMVLRVQRGAQVGDLELR